MAVPVFAQYETHHYKTDIRKESGKMRETLAINGGKPVRDQKIYYGRQSIDDTDIQEVAKPVLRHRIFLNFEGIAEGMTAAYVCRQCQLYFVLRRQTGICRY